MHLQSTIGFKHSFTLIEIYGGSHLVFPTNSTSIETSAIYGDATGYIHVPPGNKLNMTGVSPFKRVNVTWMPYVYANAELVLPKATVEFRKTASKSYPSLTIPSLFKIWGIVDGSNAHLLVGHSCKLQFELSSRRFLRYHVHSMASKIASQRKYPQMFLFSFQFSYNCVYFMEHLAFYLS